MAETTMSDGTKAWQSSFTGRQIDEKLSQVKTDSEILNLVADYIGRNEISSGKDGFSPTVTLSAISNGTRVTITDATGTKNFDVLNGQDGINGQDGSNGVDGVGISKIEKTSTDGLVDTYTITMTDGSTSSFTVTNGKNGTDGSGTVSEEQITSIVETYLLNNPPQNGVDGKDGADGVGIVSVEKTATSGLVDTYTITFTDGNTTTFTVTNGKDGESGSGSESVTDEQIATAVQTYLTENPIEATEAVENYFANNTIVSKNQNPLQDKNIVFFGDSITDNETFNSYFPASFGLYASPKTIKYYSRGGAQITNVAEVTTDDDGNITDYGNTIYNQYVTMKADVESGAIKTPDIILVMAGTNDAKNLVNYGDKDVVFTGTAQSEDITTLTTLRDSIRLICDSVYTDFPNSNIIFITPIPYAQGKDKYELGMRVRDVIIECMEIIGLPYIDASTKCGISFYREQIQKKYTTDLIHLTKDGANLVAKFIYDELVSMPFLNSANLINIKTAYTYYIRESLYGGYNGGQSKNNLIILNKEYPAGKIEEISFYAYASGNVKFCFFNMTSKMSEGASADVFKLVELKECEFVSGINSITVNLNLDSDFCFGFITDTDDSIGCGYSSASKVGGIDYETTYTDGFLYANVSVGITRSKTAVDNLQPEFDIMLKVI